MAAGLGQIAVAAEVRGGALMVARGRSNRAERTVDRVVTAQVAPAVAYLALKQGSLVEASEHGEQQDARHEQPGMRVLGEKRVEGVQRLVRRPGTAGERGPEAGATERLLRSMRPVFEARTGVRDGAERPPGLEHLTQ